MFPNFVTFKSLCCFKMECASPLHESDISEISPEEGGRDSTDVNLGCMVKDLLLLFKEFKELDNTKKEIEEKIGIKLQEHKCWSEDDIKKAWKETMDIKARNWAIVTVLQVVRRFDCDMCNQKYHSGGTSVKNYKKKYGKKGGVKKRKKNNKKKKKKCKDRKNDPASNDQSVMDGSAASERERHKEDKTIYIRIPLSKVFDNESTSTTLKPTTKVIPKYKLIDLPPEDRTVNEIKKKGFYVMSYNNETNNAKWVYEILNLNTLPSYYKTPEFKNSDSDSDPKDPTYKPSKRSDPSMDKDYDRGHLAAVANHRWCQEAYEETYWMSNITPQNNNLNRGKWKKLEEYCRKKILNDKVHNVHVYTGPLYQNDNLKYVGEKPVPSDYFKVIIVENKGGKVELECYKMPNEKEGGEEELECYKVPNEKEGGEEELECYKVSDEETVKKKDIWLRSYYVDITEIERLSGLTFTEECPSLTEVDYKKETTWKGNKGKKSVTIDVTISSYKKNDENPQVLNEE